MSDSQNIEFSINSDGKIFQDNLIGGISEIGYINTMDAEVLANSIASTMGKSITAEAPILEGELPGAEARVAIVIPPNVRAATISIRRKAVRLFTLDEYVKAGSLTSGQKEIILNWLLKRKNIVVAGGTASGKTTFLNALIAEIASLTQEHRLVVLEDTEELQCFAKNVVQMKSSEHVSLQALVKTTLRHRPDRIVVGEVRGKEAFDLLAAWSTGHPGGVSSIHANSAEGCFSRLEQLLEMAVQSPMRTLIGEAIDAIVYIEKTATGRVVKELLEVTRYDPLKQAYNTQSY